MAQRVRTSAHLALVALLASLVVALSGPPAQAADRDCGDFASQKSAQLFFLRHGGPSRDPHRLDAEGDGIACESNPAPYYFKKHLPPVTSTVRLAASRKAGIAGERLVLTVRVAPRAKRTVTLQRKVSSGWDRVAGATTSKRGRARWVTTVRASSTTYRAVLAAKKAGDTRYSGDRSAEKRVATRAQSVDLVMTKAVLVGARVHPEARAVPARPGRRVQLQRHGGRGWTVIDAGSQSRRGVVEFRFHANTAGRSAFRAVVVADGGAASVHSDRRRLTVQVPTPQDETPPSVPVGLMAMAGDARVVLSWQPVTSSDRSHYLLYRRLAAGGDWSRVGRADTEEAPFNGLVNGTAYRFAVSAVDTTGNESDRSAAVTATPVAPDTTPPPAPTDVQASAGAGSVRLTWQSVEASDLSEYRVVRRVAGTTEWSATEHTTATEWTFAGLTDGTAYEFAVSAVDTAGNASDWSVVIATPVAPPLAVPTALTASPGDGQVQLTWTGSDDSRVIGYRVEVRDTPDGAWVPAPNGVTAGTEATVTGLVNGSPYAFSVVALAADGTESSRSEVATATPSA